MKSKIQKQGGLADEAPVFKVLANLEQVIRTRGFPCRTHSRDAVQKFSHFPEERKQLILVQLEAFRDIIDVKSEVQPKEKIGTSSHSDQSLVERALKFFDLELRDDFWQGVDPEDMIEIYNRDQIQIFRSLNFFKISAYSILDLLTNEWFVLWARPKVVIEVMSELARACFSGEMTCLKPSAIPEHVVREIHKPALEPDCQSRSILAQFKNVCPVYKKSSNEIEGFLVNSYNRVLEIGDEGGRMPVL